MREEVPLLLPERQVLQFIERKPEMGSQPSWTPKRIISSRASQKSGVAKPTKTKIVVTLSNAEYWRTALTTPSRRARLTENSSAVPTLTSELTRPLSGRPHP